MAVPQLRLLLIREDIEGFVDNYLIPDDVVETIADTSWDTHCDWAISNIKDMIWNAVQDAQEDEGIPSPS